jgi:hypothetical protein
MTKNALHPHTEAHAHARIIANLVAADEIDPADWAPEDDGDWGDLWPGTDNVTVIIDGDTVHVHVHTGNEVDHAEVAWRRA